VSSAPLPSASPCSPLPTLVAQRRALALVAATLLALFAAARYGAGLRTDNRIEAWAGAVGADPAYDLLLEEFGGDSLTMVRVAGFDAEDEATARWLDALAGRLGALPGADHVIDGLHLYGLRGVTVHERLAELDQRPLAEAIDLGGAESARLDLFVVMDDSAGSAEATAFDAGFAALRVEATDLGVTLLAAGYPFVAAALDREAQTVERVFGPLLVLSAFVVCACFLRSFALTLVALLPGVVGAVSVRAGLRVVDVPSNMILVAAGPLVFVVMVASMIHLASAWRRLALAGLDPASAARSARIATWRPALVAAATTVAGFGVFLTSDVSAVRELGATVAVAVALLVPVSYALMPTALAGLVAPRPEAPRPEARVPGPSERRAQFEQHIGSPRVASVWRRTAHSAVRARTAVLAITAVLLVAGVLAPNGMPVSVSAIDYFSEGHPVRTEFSALDRASAGLSGVDVLVHAEEGVEPVAARALVAALARCPRVGSVFGPQAVAADLATLGPLGAMALPMVLRETGRRGMREPWWRFTARASVNTEEEIQALGLAVQEVAAGWSREHHYEVRVAGSLLRLHALQTALVGTLTRSLTLTALVAVIAFGLCLRGARQVLTAAVATAVPVAVVLIGARLCGFALDAATVMVASAVVGLSLDNTFHLMLAAGEGGEARRAQRFASFERVGAAAVAGICVLAVGFSCLALADFQPTARFGALAALGLVGALFADLAVIPALWIGGRARSRSGIQGAERGESPSVCSTVS